MKRIKPIYRRIIIAIGSIVLMIVLLWIDNEIPESIINERKLITGMVIPLIVLIIGLGYELDLSTAERQNDIEDDLERTLVQSEQKHQEILNTLTPLREEVSTLVHITDKNLLDKLQKMIMYHNSLALNGMFSSDDLLSSYLRNYHLSYYIQALHDVVNNRFLPLPSDLRMQAAMDAVQNTKQRILVVRQINFDG